MIAGKAVAFKEALDSEFKTYQAQVIANAQAMATMFNQAPKARLISGATDNHLLLIDVTGYGLNGKEAEEILDGVGITVNKNTIPFEVLSPFKTSGIRIGTPAVTTRGMKEEDVKRIAELIDLALSERDDHDILNKIIDEVRSITDKFPLYK